MPSRPDRSPINRPRGTEQDARGVLAALGQSGKPVSVFAAEHGLDPQRVYLCIAHDVNLRAYLHRVAHCIVHGWPQAKLRDLLPDRMLAQHPELYVGDPDALPMPPATRALAR